MMMMIWAVSADRIQYEVLTLGTNRKSRQNTVVPIACATSTPTGTPARFSRPHDRGASPPWATLASPVAGPMIQGTMCATPPIVMRIAVGFSSHPTPSAS